MGQAASQATAFYREIAASRIAWTIRDSDGYPAPITASGHWAQPFWSTRARAARIVSTVAAYRGFAVEEVAWEDLRDRHLPDLAKSGLLVGVNWTGTRATGFDVDPAQLRANVEAIIQSGV
jgi:hypothetical protein